MSDSDLLWRRLASFSQLPFATPARADQAGVVKWPYQSLDRSNKALWDEPNLTNEATVRVCHAAFIWLHEMSLNLLATVPMMPSYGIACRHIDYSNKSLRLTPRYPWQVDDHIASSLLFCNSHDWARTILTFSCLSRVTAANQFRMTRMLCGSLLPRRSL